MNKYYKITEKGKKFYLDNKASYLDICETLIDWYGRFINRNLFRDYQRECCRVEGEMDSNEFEIMKILDATSNGGQTEIISEFVVVGDNFFSDHDEKAWDYCIKHSFVDEINGSLVVTSLMDKTWRMKDQEFANNLRRYIRISFGIDISEDIDDLYKYINSKMEQLCDWEVISKSRDRRDEETGPPEEEKIYHHFLKISRDHGKKIACDWVISHLHDQFRKPDISQDEDGESFECDEIATLNLRYLFSIDSDSLTEFHDQSIILDILNCLCDSGVWEYGDSIKLDNEEKYFYERNSEHKRRIIKPTKKEKQKNVVKKHIFRKGITG